jgi:hypothetical protein
MAPTLASLLPRWYGAPLADGEALPALTPHDAFAAAVCLGSIDLARKWIRHGRVVIDCPSALGRAPYNWTKEF